MRQRIWDVTAIGLIFVAYTVTIKAGNQSTLLQSAWGGAANTAPVAIFGLLVRRIIERHLLGRTTSLQIAAHVLLAVVFSAFSYVLLIVLLGIGESPSQGGFLVKPFSRGGTAWQSLENLTTYALIAAMVYLRAQHAGEVRHPLAAGPLPAGVPVPHPDLTAPDSTRAGVLPATPKTSAAPAETSPSRFFVREGDDLRPLDTDSIVSIEAADDYCQVKTLGDSYLVRKALAEFERSLDPNMFVRAHRSWIINLKRITRVEPAGSGRLLVHMETGATFTSSRAGAQRLRSRVI